MITYNPCRPKKRSKNHPLTKREQVKNRQINRIRVKVEYVMGDIKSHVMMVDAYDGTLEEFETEFNVVTGLVNLHAMWKKTRRNGKRACRHRPGLHILTRWNGIMMLRCAFYPSGLSCIFVLV